VHRGGRAGEPAAGELDSRSVSCGGQRSGGCYMQAGAVYNPGLIVSTDTSVPHTESDGYSFAPKSSYLCLIKFIDEIINVCCILNKYLLLIKAVRGRLSFRVLPFPFPLPAKFIPILGCHSVFCQCSVIPITPSPQSSFSFTAITCVFMSISVTVKIYITSLPKSTCYFCTMCSSR
jgi:hypothetical protein